MYSTAASAVVELGSLKLHGGRHPVVTRGGMQLHTVCSSGEGVFYVFITVIRLMYSVYFACFKTVCNERLVFMSIIT